VFRHQLALALGKTKEELRDMPRAEFVDWLAYDRIEPFGLARADMQAGIIASVIVNALSKKGKSKPSDFRLKFRSRGPVSREEAAKNIVRNLGIPAGLMKAVEGG
jgi:hypothetical protein